MYQELLELASTVNSNNVIEVLTEMFEISNKSLNNILDPKNNMALHEFKVAVERMDLTWNLVANKTGNWYKQNAFSAMLSPELLKIVGLDGKIKPN